MSKSYQDQWFDLKKEYAKEIEVNFYEFCVIRNIILGFGIGLIKIQRK
jgi:hypothetical protein